MVVYLMLPGRMFDLRVGSLLKVKLAVVLCLTMSTGTVCATESFGERENVLPVAIAAEIEAEKRGATVSPQVSQPSPVRVQDSGIVGETNFGDVGISFDASLDLESSGRKGYVVDQSHGAVVKSEGEVGVLMRVLSSEDLDGVVEEQWALDLPDGVQAFILPEGGVGFRLAKEGGVTAISETVISAPWAVDSQGNSLETWYELDADGKTIVQFVDSVSAQGDIVVDPRITYGRGVYINWWGGELRALKAGGSSSLALAAGYGCLKAGKLRHPAVVAVVGLVCLTAGSTASLWLLRNALNNVRHIFDGRCYQWKVGSSRINSVGARGNCY